MEINKVVSGDNLILTFTQLSQWTLVGGIKNKHIHYLSSYAFGKRKTK